VTDRVTSVPGELHYLAPGSSVLRRFTALGASVNTGRYEPRTVAIRNGRPVQDTFRLDVHGFEIVAHRSAVRDFTDRAEVDAVDVPEVISFVKRQTGAEEVAAVTAARVYAEQFPDGPGYRRVLATSVWRVFSPPPQDWPLALCDFRSVRDDEALPNQLYFVDRLPDDPFAEVDESEMITSGSEFHYRPEHE
jgi:hypothetical protein